MAYSRFYFLLVFIGIGFCSRSQILEEMSAVELEAHIDSLLSIDEQIEAYAQFYAYTNFLPNYSSNMHEREKILEIRERVENSITFLQGLTPDKLYSYYKPVIERALMKQDYQKAMYMISSFKDELPEVKKRYDSLLQILPNDTIHLTVSGVPIQLYSSPPLTLYSTNHNLPDSLVFYSKADSSLYSGVIISRFNNSMTMESGIASLTYDTYENGIRIERKQLGYTRSNEYHHNNLFFGYDSCHYRLSMNTLSNRTDTIRTYFYYYDEDISKEMTALKNRYGANTIILTVEYNTDGSIKRWEELAPYSPKHDKYENYTCYLNQFGDTISEDYELRTEGKEISQYRRLNDQGDTLDLSRTIDGLFDGLQIERLDNSDGDYLELRYNCTAGKLSAILVDSTVYFDEDWKVISKERFIEIMNTKEYPCSFMGVGLFKEYFPNTELSNEPYFMTEQDYITNKNYKKFRKACEKYFGMKLK